MAGFTEGGTVRALVVEDEFLVSLDIAQMLASAGYEVVGPAGRIDEALRLVEGEDHLSVAVLDVNIAGQRIWPVARELRRRGVPFVFVTGYVEAHAGIPPELSDAPVLPKPVDPDRFVSTVRDLAPGYGAPTLNSRIR